MGVLPKSAPLEPPAYVAPVLVMPDPAKTAKEAALPRSIPEVRAFASCEMVAVREALRATITAKAAVTRW